MHIHTLICVCVGMLNLIILSVTTKNKDHHIEVMIPLLLIEQCNTTPKCSDLKENFYFSHDYFGQDSWKAWQGDLYCQLGETWVSVIFQDGCFSTCCSCLLVPLSSWSSMFSIGGLGFSMTYWPRSSWTSEIGGHGFERLTYEIESVSLFITRCKYSTLLLPFLYWEAVIRKFWRCWLKKRQHEGIWHLMNILCIPTIMVTTNIS